MPALPFSATSPSCSLEGWLRRCVAFSSWVAWDLFGRLFGRVLVIHCYIFIICDDGWGLPHFSPFFLLLPMLYAFHGVLIALPWTQLANVPWIPVGAGTAPVVQCVWPPAASAALHAAPPGGRPAEAPQHSSASAAAVLRVLLRPLWLMNLPITVNAVWPLLSWRRRETFERNTRRVDGVRFASRSAQVIPLNLNRQKQKRFTSTSIQNILCTRFTFPFWLLRSALVFFPL